MNSAPLKMRNLQPQAGKHTFNLSKYYIRDLMNLSRSVQTFAQLTISAESALNNFASRGKLTPKYTQYVYDFNEKVFFH